MPRPIPSCDQAMSRPEPELATGEDVSTGWKLVWSSPERTTTPRDGVGEIRPARSAAPWYVKGLIVSCESGRLTTPISGWSASVARSFA